MPSWNTTAFTFYLNYITAITNCVLFIFTLLGIHYRPLDQFCYFRKLALIAWISKRIWIFPCFYMPCQRDKITLSLKRYIYCLILRISRSQKVIFLAKISFLSWQIPSKLYVNNTQHFPYFLKYHYSPVGLENKTSIPLEFFLEFMNTKFYSKWKGKDLLFSFSKKQNKWKKQSKNKNKEKKQKKKIFSWSERLEISVIKVYEL